MSFMSLKFKCTSCGIIGCGRKPKGGDGTYYYPRRHYVGGSLCPGCFTEAEWVSPTNPPIQPTKRRPPVAGSDE